MAVAAPSPAAVLGPQAGPQSAFLGASQDLVLYGGAAGGGPASRLRCSLRPFGTSITPPIRA
jgi:hypothetical protein